MINSYGHGHKKEMQKNEKIFEIGPHLGGPIEHLKVLVHNAPM